MKHDFNKAAQATYYKYIPPHVSYCQKCQKKWRNALCNNTFWAFVTFHRKRSTFQNIWRRSSGSICTWTLTSDVLKNTPYVSEPWRQTCWKVLLLLWDVTFVIIIMRHKNKTWFRVNNINVQVRNNVYFDHWNFFGWTIGMFPDVHVWTLTSTSWVVSISYRTSHILIG